MKTTASPSIRVEADFLAEIETVRAEADPLSQFVEASVLASVERHRVRAEFIARGLRSREEARRAAGYVDADGDRRPVAQAGCRTHALGVVSGRR